MPECTIGWRLACLCDVPPHLPHLFVRLVSGRLGTARWSVVPIAWGAAPCSPCERDAKGRLPCPTRRLPPNPAQRLPFLSRGPRALLLRGLRQLPPQRLRQLPPQRLRPRRLAQQQFRPLLGVETPPRLRRVAPGSHPRVTVPRLHRRQVAPQTRRRAAPTPPRPRQALTPTVAGEGRAAAATAAVQRADLGREATPATQSPAPTVMPTATALPSATMAPRATTRLRTAATDAATPARGQPQRHGRRHRRPSTTVDPTNSLTDPVKGGLRPKPLSVRWCASRRSATRFLRPSRHPLATRATQHPARHRMLPAVPGQRSDGGVGVGGAAGRVPDAPRVTARAKGRRRGPLVAAVALPVRAPDRGSPGR